MRWFERSGVLCVLMVVLTPAPAHAWFEFLDYLSGPGPFYGAKADFRVWCSGERLPFGRLQSDIHNAAKNMLSTEEGLRTTGAESWEDIVKRLRPVADKLRLLDQDKLDDKREDKLDELAKRATSLRSRSRESIPAIEFLMLRYELETLLDKAHKRSISIGSTGIFASFCDPEKIRSLAVEIGVTSLQANSNPDYAQEHTIRLNQFTGALSYRVPLPVDRDFIDLGVIAGMYRFSSRGFERFSGLTVQPFVDLHGPTSLVNEPGLKQLAGLFTLRLGLVFFPGGFDGEQFASVPSKPARISGWEATPSATIYFNLSPLFRRRPPPPAPNATMVP